jgi:hypothetical protein
MAAHKADCAFVLNFESACSCGAETNDRVESARKETLRVQEKPPATSTQQVLKDLLSADDITALYAVLGGAETYVDNSHNSYKEECGDCGGCTCNEDCLRRNSDDCYACEIAFYFDKASEVIARINRAYNGK